MLEISKLNDMLEIRQNKGNWSVGWGRRLGTEMREVVRVGLLRQEQMSQDLKVGSQCDSDSGHLGEESFSQREKKPLQRP